jgi:uncharacterized protein
MGDISQEPSMEEILSSIKRIIAEDSSTALSAPRVKRAVVAPSADPVPDHVAEPEVLELTEAAPEESAPATAVPVADAPVIEKPELASSATVTASRSSIAALSALVVKPAVAGSDTLEGMVRDMLKPMLAEWLDTHLAAIVERAVAQEIARISARG